MEIAGMIFVTAVIFTFVGYRMSVKHLSRKMTISIIDTLINDGYLRVSGKGDNQIILKYDDTDE